MSTSSEFSGILRTTSEPEKGYKSLLGRLLKLVIAYPNSENVFIFDTDASNHAIGAELLQVQNGVEWLISFAVLSLTLRNYCTTRKGILAVVQFTRHFRHHLLG